MSNGYYIENHNQYTATAPIQNDTFFGNYSISDKEKMKRKLASSMLMLLLRDMACIKGPGVRSTAMNNAMNNAKDAMRFIHTKTCKSLCEAINIDHKKFIEISYDIYDARNTSARFRDILINAGFDPSFGNLK